VTHLLECGGSFVGMWWLICWNVVAHLLECGGSFVGMWWLCCWNVFAPLLAHSVTRTMISMEWILYTGLLPVLAWRGEISLVAPKSIYILI
jgi:hypothetical protein